MPAAKTGKPKDKPPLEELSYEQALGELEAIVTALEAGKSALEESTNLFERGQMLVQYCARLLDQAELKVQQLSGEALSDLKPSE